MSSSSRSLLLEQEVALLIQHFGVVRVRAAVRKVANGNDNEPQKLPRRSGPSETGRMRPSIANGLESLRKTNPEKHRLLSQFLNQLKDRRILPEAQDIRHFAHIIGLKNISGKSRKDMIPPLMRFLLEQPNERLWTDLEKAKNISEQQRQEGFSVLTDKLLGKNDAA